MNKVIWVLWPSFVAAVIAEFVFFWVINPQQLYFLGEPVEMSSYATYSVGFLLFWLVCAGSSLLTWFMLPQRPQADHHHEPDGRTAPHHGSGLTSAH
ncbi:hypothetical protein OTERR_03360 [Oryzomicrobium terrae]|uniref:Transmembrane protein n=1 Tax=Oryzomicrobium terrae TaxID=1735038 RepID=A0A5C1E4I2_9RHOO|nr:hypothetical protein [Oryzomicrobium terrae]QEL63812.1 hypothetical protein OTERR_03360 [Oryzomicrobium terrae]